MHNHHMHIPSAAQLLHNNLGSLTPAGTLLVSSPPYHHRTRHLNSTRPVPSVLSHGCVCTSAVVLTAREAVHQLLVPLCVVGPSEGILQCAGGITRVLVLA
jgi:hypothetical protein